MPPTPPAVAAFLIIIVVIVTMTVIVPVIIRLVVTAMLIPVMLPLSVMINNARQSITRALIHKINITGGNIMPIIDKKQITTRLARMGIGVNNLPSAVITRTNGPVLRIT
jgi:hypothetical protein